MENKKVSLEYLAGAIDCDGSITVYRKEYKRKTTGKIVTYYEPRISLGQITPQIPEILHKRFGGYIYTYYPKRLNSKPYHQWMVSNTNCEGVLNELLPFLVIKNEQANIAIKMCKLLSRRTNNRSANMITEEEEGERKLLWEQMNIANKNGRRRKYIFGKLSNK